MKRLLSILLALSLVISIIPAVFAADEPYTETYSFEGSNGIMLYELTEYNYTEGEVSYGNKNWKYFDMEDSLLKAIQENTASQSWCARVYYRSSYPYLYFYTTNGTQGNTNYYKLNLPVKFALTLKAPEKSAFYAPVIDWGTSNKNVSLNVYIKQKGESVKSYEDSADEKNIVGSFSQTSAASTISSATDAVYLNGGEVVAAFEGGKYKYVFKGVTLTEVQGAELQITAENTDSNGNIEFTTENASETVAITSTKVDGDNIEPMDVAGGFVEYVSDKGEVATVDENGVITVGNTVGTAHITAQSPDGLVTSNPITVNVTAPAEEPEEPGEAVTDTKVSVAVQSENTEEGTVLWSGATIAEVNMGDTVTATATANDGSVFRYWKNAIGQVLSENAEESFVINTNTAITAVFDKIDDTAATVSVELFNANGMPFDNKTVNKDTTFADAIDGVGTPTYTGFGSFKHWSMYADESKIADDMLIKKNTRAVAIFNEPTEEYTVSVNGSPVHSDVLYSTEVTVSSDSADFSYWKLGEKIVSYEPNYKFTVWGDVNLVPVTGEDVEAAPVAVLDEVDGNPLLIYSVPEGYNVVEAGILFGSTADITIYSVDGGRAAAARGTGQFTAQPKDSNKAIARGYLIFKNASGETRILYAD